MKGTTLKRELVFATFCSAVFAALLVFQSCSSKQKKSDEGTVAEAEETLGDAAEGESAEAEADAADLEATLETQASGAKNSELTEGTTANSEFDIPKTSETTESNLDIPSAPPESSTSQDVATAPSGDASMEASADGAAEPRKAVAYSGRARTPRIPGRAVKRKGMLLNRFYFARNGDNATKVSQLLYGSEDRAGSLMRWNGQDSKWKAGDLLFYASAADAADTQMKSFYQERSVTPEEYVVKPGEWLSQIAKSQLGHPGSWKEIAVVNGLESPDAIEKGQKLAVYPANLSAFSEVAQNEAAPSKTEMAAAAPEATPPPVEAPAQIAPPPPPVDEASDAKPERQQAKGGLDVAKLLEQNLFAVVVGSALVLLLVALLAVNKRKKKASDDLADDGFSSNKARRK